MSADNLLCQMCGRRFRIYTGSDMTVCQECDTQRMLRSVPTMEVIVKNEPAPEPEPEQPIKIMYSREDEGYIVSCPEIRGITGFGTNTWDALYEFSVALSGAYLVMEDLL